MTTPEAIRHIRKRLGKTQQEFAQVLRCRQDTLSRYERGKLAPSALLLIALLDMADPEEKQALAGQVQEYSRRGLIGPNVDQFTKAMRPLLTEMQLSWEILGLVPETKRADPGYGQFIPAVAHIIETCPTIDPSVPLILQLWTAHREKPQTAALMRDVLGYLRNALWGTGKG